MSNEFAHPGYRFLSQPLSILCPALCEYCMAELLDGEIFQARNAFGVQ
jgi:hypothetical protein